MSAIWITGLPGSGKSTLADMIKAACPDVIVLRMDDLRKIATPRPTYSEEERDMVYGALIYAAKAISEAGLDVIIDATGNLRRWRELARNVVPEFAEVYLKCPVDVCISREKDRHLTRGAPRAVYEKGSQGWPVPGMGAPYEEPLSPDLTIDTSVLSPEECLKEALKLIKGFEVDCPLS